MKRSLVLLAMALVGVGPAGAQDSRAAAVPDRAWVLTRVARLDAENYEARELAMRELLAAGAGIEEALRAELGQGSPERQARVVEILSRLRRRTESRSIRPTATEVTLRVSDRPLPELLKRWTEATQTKVFLDNPRIDVEKPLTLELDRVPLLKALDALCEVTGSQFQWDVRRKGYSLSPTVARQGPVTYAGPVRISVQSLQITRSTTFTTPSMTSVSLNGMVDIEPTWPLFGVITPFRAFEVLDDKDRSLAPSESRQVDYLQRTPEGQRSWWNLQLAAPEHDARAIKRLKISCRLLVADEVAVVEIPDPKSDPSATFGDNALRVVVEVAETHEGVTTLTLRVEAPPPEGPIPVASRNQGTDVRVEATSADGTKVDFSGYGTSTLQNGVRWSGTLKGAMPASLRVSVPIHVMEVPFEPIFENLLLP